MSSRSKVDTEESTGEAIPPFFGQLAAAGHIRRLVERYVSVAPLFIGGPSTTSLEESTASKEAVAVPSCGNMYNPSSFYNHPSMTAVAVEQHNRRVYDRVRAMHHYIAAVQQQQHHQQHQHQLAHPQHLQPPPPPPQQHQHSADQRQLPACQGSRQMPKQRQKRRRTHSNEPSAAPTHLSGEMIRRLREKQKLKNAAAVASAVATAAAVTTSSGRQFERAVAQTKPSTASVSAPAKVELPPLMSRRDMTSADLEETLLVGTPVCCFNIGGEMRLCLPQILRQILGDFHWEQICLACEELQIHVAPATTQQLIVLKGAGVLPIAAHQCGLITKSDAERLASFLMSSNVANARKVDTSILEKSAADDNKEVHVQHECFGKAAGLLQPALYNSPDDKCIKCDVCGIYLDPISFVRHLHSERENRTCHWGFDSEHWRSYLHLSDKHYKKVGDKDLSADEAQSLLDEVKARFKDSQTTESDPQQRPAKRPRLVEEDQRPSSTTSSSATFRPWNNRRQQEGQKLYQTGPRHNDLLGEDLSHYVAEVKQSLSCERGLNPRNRDLVMEVLGRLADRVQSAESSRNAVVSELVGLRHRFQSLEAELSKKCDELRQLFLLQHAHDKEKEDEKVASPTSSTNTASALRNMRKVRALEFPAETSEPDAQQLTDKLSHVGDDDDEDDDDDDEEEEVTEVDGEDEDDRLSNCSSKTGLLDRPAMSPSFSRDLEALKNSLHEQDSESLRERMKQIEEQLKQLQSKMNTNPASEKACSSAITSTSNDDEPDAKT